MQTHNVEKGRFISSKDASLSEEINKLSIKNPLCIGIYKGEHGARFFLNDYAKKYDTVILIDNYEYYYDRKYQQPWSVNEGNRDNLIEYVQNQITENNTTFIINDCNKIDYNSFNYDFILFAAGGNETNIISSSIKKASYVCFEMYGKTTDDQLIIYNAKIDKLLNENILINPITAYTGTKEYFNKFMPYLICTVNNDEL